MKLVFAQLFRTLLALLVRTSASSIVNSQFTESALKGRVANLRGKVAVPRDDQTGQICSTSSGGSETSLLSGLPPGTYAIFVYLVAGDKPIQFRCKAFNGRNEHQPVFSNSDLFPASFGKSAQAHEARTRQGSSRFIF